jgi:hypothetical protein
MLVILAFPLVTGEVIETFRGHGGTELLFAAPPEKAAGSPFVAVTVPIDLWNGLPIIEVRVNDQGPFPLLLVTASQTMTLSADLVESLNLPRIGPETPEKATVEVRSVHLGSLVFEDFPAAVMDSSGFGNGKDAPQGLLGLSLFVDHLTTIDYANGALLLEKGSLPAADGKRILEYEHGAKDGLTVPLQVGDLTVNAVLDATIPGSVALHTRYIDKLSLDSEPRVIGRSINEDGEFPLLSARYDGPIRLGDLDIERNSLRFFDVVPEGGVGNEVLQELSLTIDQATQRIRVRRNDAVARRMQEEAAAVGSLSENGDDLRTAFNRDVDKVRMLLILSPT